MGTHRKTLSGEKKKKKKKLSTYMYYQLVVEDSGRLCVSSGKTIDTMLRKQSIEERERGKLGLACKKSQAEKPPPPTVFGSVSGPSMDNVNNTKIETIEAPRHEGSDEKHCCWWW